ncbi:diacylglycerol/lipid kinase family protein [Nocardioides flavescens]|uniref:diacylglycerol/lipid kinase family protein n=1 Tax=Nocardioides flavescens TaxID=2691959 RepID=UPI00192979F2|nr:YegS/Rv2252/BmrU family lipid kinase [Nocardioides flavescens]
MDPLLVITNSDAGTADDETLAAALAVLRERCSVEVTATSDPGELDSALHRAGGRRIVVAGGDGSMHAVVAALYRRNDLEDAVLGLLPLGTGNDFARTNHIPLDVEEAARVILEGTPRPMDLIVDEVGEIVVNNVHAGAGAQASRRGARWKKRLHEIGVGKVNLGKLGYPIGALQAAVQPPFIRVRVEADGEVLVDLDEPILMVAVGNGADVGGGTALTPGADPGDGRVDVMVSRSVGPLARVAYAAALVAGRHTKRDDVIYQRATTVTVSGEEFWCSADGEIYGPERHRSWRVQPAAYKLVVPGP